MIDKTELVRDVICDKIKELEKRIEMLESPEKTTNKYYIVYVEYREFSAPIRYLVNSRNPFYWLKNEMNRPDGRIASFQEITKDEWKDAWEQEHRIKDMK